jgi:TonB family protein
VRPTELPDPLHIAFDGFSPPETDLSDPVFASIVGQEEFDEPLLATSRLFVEFDEPVRLDPERSGLIWEIPPAATGWAIRWRAPLVSLAFHLLPVAVVLLLPLLVVEPPPPIPVQLVLEPPPPPPSPPPAPAPKPRPPPPPPKMEVGRLASVDMGAIKQTDTLGRAADPVTPPAAGEQQPTPSETEKPPQPAPSPQPTPPKEQKSAFAMPKPSAANVPHHAETPHEAPHSAKYPGPAATRDEYFAYLVALTRRHIDLLPRGLASEHQGETALSIAVADNGTVERITVMRSSGSSELDEKVISMVRAVGRFPPLPQWFQGEVMDMEFRVGFPVSYE